MPGSPLRGLLGLGKSLALPSRPGVPDSPEIPSKHSRLVPPSRLGQFTDWVSLSCSLIGCPFLAPFLSFPFLPFLLLIGVELTAGPTDAIVYRRLTIKVIDGEAIRYQETLRFEAGEAQG